MYAICFDLDQEAPGLLAGQHDVEEDRRRQKAFERPRRFGQGAGGATGWRQDQSIGDRQRIIAARERGEGEVKSAPGKKT